MLKTEVSALHVFSPDTLLKLHNLILTSVNTGTALSFLSLLLFLFLDLLHLLKTPVLCWMKAMIMGIFLFLQVSKGSFKDLTLKYDFYSRHFEYLLADKGCLFYSECSENVTIGDSFLSNVLFFSSYWDGLMNFLLIFHCKLIFIISTNIGYLDKANLPWFIVMTKISLIRLR